MGIGVKIKEYRSKLGLTQKDLADKLNVTFQAVSRWENDDVEPSFDTVKEMAKLFNCSIDDLFGVENTPTEDEPKQEQVKIVEKVVVQEHKPVLAVCEQCNKPIYDANEIRRVEKIHHVGRHTETKKYVLCKECDAKRLAEEKRQADEKRRQELDSMRKRRIHSFIWPTIVALILIIVAITKFTGGDSKTGGILLAIGILSFTFISCWILFNNFVPEMWMSISSWSVKFPGVIFTLDLDGILALIFIKILFGILSFLISAAAIVFATALSLVVSIFVYPFALAKNIRGVE